MEKILQKISEVWGKLPSEVKVGIYYAGAVALNDIAASLLGTEPLQLNVVIKVFIANLLLVFVKELKPRVERLRNL